MEKCVQCICNSFFFVAALLFTLMGALFFSAGMAAVITQSNTHVSSTLSYAVGARKPIDGEILILFGLTLMAMGYGFGTFIKPMRQFDLDHQPEYNIV